MKRSYIYSSLLLMALITLLMLPCCERISKPFEPDENSQYDQEAENYAFMHIFNFQTEWPSWPESGMNSVSLEILVVKRQAEPKDTLTSIDMGSVRIGSYVFKRDRVNDGSSRCIWNVGSIIILPDWRFTLSLTMPNNRDPIPGLIGKVPFSINDSPDIRDVDTFLDMPPRNVITNIQAGQEIDPNQDLTVQVKCPISPNGYFTLYAYKAEGNGLHVSSIGVVNINPPDESDTIVIPKEELLKLVQDYLNVDFYAINIIDSRIIAEVSLYDYDGNLYQTLNIRMRDHHEVEISFKSQD